MLVDNSEKTKLKQKLEKLKQKERTIIEREKQAQKKNLLELGRLVAKAKISNLDTAALLGAFLEISERSNDNDNLLAWREKSKITNSEQDTCSLAITFKSPVSLEIKEKLKQVKFRWNSFRGEYYGRGNITLLRELLEDIDHKIEVVQ